MPYISYRQIAPNIVNLYSLRSGQAFSGDEVTTEDQH